MQRVDSSASWHQRGGGQRAAILVLAILQIVATMLPSIGIGEAIGDRSDEARTAITPAGGAFSIWGPLFAGCIAYAIYQLPPAQKNNQLLAKVGWASAGAFLGNAVWALYTQFLGLNFGSALIIIFTLVCLLAIYRSFAREPNGFSWGELALVVVPLSALAAWLTAATIVNIAAVLDYHGLDLGDATEAVGAAVVLVGALIASVAIWNGRGNPWYAAVFLWALGGIFAASRPEDPAIATAAIIGAICVAITTIVRLVRAREGGRWFHATRRAAPSRAL
jgi:MFS family permease